MAGMAESYAALETRVRTWAAARPDIRLALVVGSRARSEFPGDDWADLDIVIFTTTPQVYHNSGWLSAFGEVWAAYRDRLNSGDAEWLVVLAGGLDFDLAVLPAENPLTAGWVWSRLDDVLARGYRVLLDRDGVVPRLPTATPQAAPLPDAFTFQNTVHGFWRTVERIAKKLRRGEVWMAHALCDRTLKDFLLQMAAWYARSAAGGVDTWYEGHFFEQWADPRLVDGLRTAFAAYDTGDIWRALWVTIDLFRWLGAETAVRLGYDYPAEADRQIITWVRQLDEKPDQG